MADADGTTAAGAAVAAPPDLPSPPPLQPDSTSSPPPSTPTCATPATATATATAGTPSLPDTPASAADDTPLSDADAAADIHAFSDAAAATPVFSDAAAESLDGDEQTIPSSAKKRMILPPPPPPAKKAKKKSSNVWTKSTSRKGKKKPKQPPAPGGGGAAPEDAVLITPAPRLLADRSDDAPHAPVLLSRVHKSEKVELSEDRLTAGSAKGYRMVRATRGVAAGAWYFEIKVAHLGATGHTRLGWATNKGDLQAPVGYDAHGFGYRDIDGSKVHKALREKYGSEGCSEGDVIGFYINLPDGQLYEPKPPKLVLFKGQRYFYSVDGKDEPPKVVPGSEISFFKNGICQGTAFTDLFGGRYYPAASMYTLPNQPNCEVRFNFGPDFEFFPQDFGGRPIPRPVSEVPYHGYDQKNNGPAENGIAEKQS